MKSIVKLIIVFMIFFTGTCGIMILDTICKETTGYGGKLVFDVEKAVFIN